LRFLTAGVGFQIYLNFSLMARRLFAACIAGLSAVHCVVAASAGVLRGGEGEQQVLSAADQFSTSAVFSAAQLKTCPYLAEAGQIKK